VKNTVSKSHVNVAILTPQSEELQALKVVFKHFTDDTNLAKKLKVGYTLSGSLSTEDPKGNLDISIIPICGKYNDTSALFTERILSRINPDMMVLIGSAAGRHPKVEIGDIVVPLKIRDLRLGRMCLTEASGNIIDKSSFQTQTMQVTDTIKTRLDRFKNYHLVKDKVQDRISKKIKEYLNEVYREEIPEALTIKPPTFHLKERFGSSDMILEGDSVFDIFKKQQREIDAYDMESIGFANACSLNEFNKWIIFRGISDYGQQNPGGKNDHHLGVTIIAALFLREFLRYGLREIHPHPLAVQEIQSPPNNINFDFIGCIINKLEEWERDAVKKDKFVGFHYFFYNAFKEFSEEERKHIGYVINYLISNEIIIKSYANNPLDRTRKTSTVKLAENYREKLEEIKMK